MKVIFWRPLGPGRFLVLQYDAAPAGLWYVSRIDLHAPRSEGWGYSDRRVALAAFTSWPRDPGPPVERSDSLAADLATALSLSS